MSELPLELVCPKCGIEVQPIKAADAWFCPHCARQFTEAEIEQQRRGQADSGEDPSRDAPPSN
jgi:predicted amidophosphoribosyltransferase